MTNNIRITPLNVLLKSKCKGNESETANDGLYFYTKAVLLNVSSLLRFFNFLFYQTSETPISIFSKATVILKRNIKIYSNHKIKNKKLNLILKILFVLFCKESNVIVFVNLIVEITINTHIIYEYIICVCLIQN